MGCVEPQRRPCEGCTRVPQAKLRLHRYVIQGPNDPWFPDNVPILFSGSAAVTCPTPCRVETSEKALGRVGAALGASGSPGGRAELLVLRKSLSPAGPPPDKPFSFAGF